MYRQVLGHSVTGRELNPHYSLHFLQIPAHTWHTCEGR